MSTGRPGPGRRGPADHDGPAHPTVAALVLVIAVVLFIVAMSVASVYF